MKDGTTEVKGKIIPWKRYHTLVAGSGAAGLAAAVKLYRSGVLDIAVVTESVKGGTSYNTGSDKQTYYKLSVSGPEADSPHEMARSIYDGGSAHGDTALVEATGSTEAFYQLLTLGVPFPKNRYGGYVGYKTDHDPARRGISLGPYTSKIMVEHLLREVKLLGIPVFERREIISLLTRKTVPPVQTDRNEKNRRVSGFLAIDRHQVESDSHGFELWFAGNIVFALGGPGGLYASSVYPAVHTGGIGIALEAGAEGVNLTESQYGIASIRHRWNVSGTYQQVIPRYFSTDQDGGDEQEFLNPWFSSMSELAGRIFLKGYQWPFDPGKIAGRGSSIIDILVYHEREVKGRRVFLDYRENPRGDNRIGSFNIEEIEAEAGDYLENSGALFGIPIERLRKMNPIAVDQYMDHGIDIAKEPLEISVSAQHNNGGLAVDIWWESTNIARLFPIGEVAGTHGVYRPGGSALNAGQVGALRAAMKIAADHSSTLSDEEGDLTDAREHCGKFLTLADTILSGKLDHCSPSAYLRELQQRMSREAGHIRNPETIVKALKEAEAQLAQYGRIYCESPAELPRAFKVRQLAIAHLAYLSAINYYVTTCEGGSRGSSIVLDPEGETVHPDLSGAFRYRREQEELRDYLLSTELDTEIDPALGTSPVFKSSLVNRRPIPCEDFWFENVWKDFREGTVFKEK